MDIFIDKRGNDRKGDGTRAKPYRTVERALKGIVPGHIIRPLESGQAPKMGITQLFASVCGLLGIMLAVWFALWGAYQLFQVATF